MRDKRIISGLQAARGFAAVLIVFFHADLSSNVFYGQKQLLGFWNFGLIGVDFFFVLSGFTIYWIHSNDSANIISALTFIKKRIFRIYPPYLLVTIVLLLTYHFFPALSNPNRNIGILTSLLLIPSNTFAPALIVAWTLMLEMFFYLLFVIFYINKTIFKIIFLIWVAVIIVLNLSVGSQVGKILYLSPYNLEFILGMFAAIIAKKMKVNSLHLILGSLILIVFVILHNGHFNSNELFNGLLKRLILGGSFLLIVTGLLSIDPKLHYPRSLLFLGSASYSIFLIHTPVISILNRVAAIVKVHVDVPPMVLFFMIVILSILVGMLFYLFFEKPVFRILKKKFIT